jgi:pyruvate kinase
MDLARINTGHDELETWQEMVTRIRASSRRLERPCRIHLDLAGPKLRTGPIRKGHKVFVGPGDPLIVTFDERPGEAAVKTDGKVIRPARVGCTLPEMLSGVRVGDVLQIDDGKVSARAVACHMDHIVFEIMRSRHGGVRIKAEKGLVFPGSSTSFPALTREDRENLSAMIDSVDLVGQSFVRRAEEVTDLVEALARLGRKDVGVVAKIETIQAFEQLPQIVLAGMRAERFGIMIARGDLALEVGFERLAEVQEEILWLCEAGRIPVIWATQVLERLAKKGVPARGEITDAAMSVRAECVMLNKGPYIRQALASLVDILRRMADHQSKKTAMMRRLASWNV